MGYGDYSPSGNYHKKPLTKQQLEKIKENFAKGSKIAEHMQKLEEKEKQNNTENLEEKLDSLFI